MGDCRRPSWIVQKVTDLFLRVRFPEEMRNFRDLEKALNEVADYEKKKETIYALTKDLVEGNLCNLSSLAKILSARAREELPEKYRKEFREIQVAQRDVVFNLLDGTAGSTEIYKSHKLQLKFAQGVQALSACLDNPNVQIRLSDYLTDCMLPVQCRQAILDSFRGFRYKKLETVLVTEIQSALRDRRRNWGDVEFLVAVASSMLQAKIADKYYEDDGPLVKFFGGIVSCLPRYQILAGRNQRFIGLSCEMIVSLPLEMDWTGEERILCPLAKRLVDTLRKSTPSLGVSKEYGLYLCDKFLENNLGLPSRGIKTFKLSIEGAKWKINDTATSEKKDC